MASHCGPALRGTKRSKPVVPIGTPNAVLYASDSAQEHQDVGSAGRRALGLTWKRFGVSPAYTLAGTVAPVWHRVVNAATSAPSPSWGMVASWRIRAA